MPRPRLNGHQLEGKSSNRWVLPPPSLSAGNLRRRQGIPAGHLARMCPDGINVSGAVLIVSGCLARYQAKTWRESRMYAVLHAHTLRAWSGDLPGMCWPSPVPVRSPAVKGGAVQTATSAVGIGGM